MKKLLLILTIAVAVALPVSAQRVHTTVKTENNGGSFFAPIVKSLIVSNTINVTNLTIPGVTGTNVTSTVYTNLNGTRVITTATSGTNVNLLGSVPLWSRNNGEGAWNQALTNVVGYLPGDAAISYSLVGGSGANSAVLFVFSPSWDGVNVDTTGNFDFVFSVTATTTTQIQSATNAPMYKWIGARALVCKSVGTADTDAASQVVLKSLKLTGFGPP